MASSSAVQPRKLPCLMCERKVRETVDCGLLHIRKHLGYKRFDCQACNFSCDIEDESLQHKWCTGHPINFNEDEYMESLTVKIYMDCIRAVENGIGAVIAENKRYIKNVRDSCSGTSRLNAIGGSPSGSGKGKSNKRKNSVEEHDDNDSDVQQLPDTTIDDITVVEIKNNDTEQRNVKIGRTKEMVTTGHPAEVTKRASLTSSEASRVFITDGSDKHGQTSRELPTKDVTVMKTNLTIVNCKKCGQAVACDYLHRREHVSRKHLVGNMDTDLLESSRSEELKKCFPGFNVYRDTQCNECGKSYKSETGRREHVVKEHFHQDIKCPLAGCTVVLKFPADLKKHIQVDHKISFSSEKNAEIFRVFDCVKKNFDASLAPAVLRHFPIPLSSQREITNSKGTFDDARSLPSASTSERLQPIHALFADEIKRRKTNVARNKRAKSSSSSDSGETSISKVNTISAEAIPSVESSRPRQIYENPRVHQPTVVAPDSAGNTLHQRSLRDALITFPRSDSQFMRPVICDRAGSTQKTFGSGQHGLLNSTFCTSTRPVQQGVEFRPGRYGSGQHGLLNSTFCTSTRPVQQGVEFRPGSNRRFHPSRSISLERSVRGVQKVIPDVTDSRYSVPYGMSTMGRHTCTYPGNELSAVPQGYSNSSRNRRTSNRGTNRGRTHRPAGGGRKKPVQNNGRSSTRSRRRSGRSSGSNPLKGSRNRSTVNSTPVEETYNCGLDPSSSVGKEAGTESINMNSEVSGLSGRRTCKLEKNN